MNHHLQLRTLVTLMLLALTTLATGCVMPFFGSYGAATPEDAARQAHSRGNPSAMSQNFSVLGSRTSGRRSVVFWTETVTPPSQSSPSQMFGIEIATLDSGGWISNFSSSQAGATAPVAPALVCAGIDSGVDNLGGYTIVYGHVRLPDVASLEVDFSSGATLKDTTGDGLFAVIMAKPDTPTKLRLMDSNGQTIHTVTLAQVAPPSPPPGPARGGSGATVMYGQSQTIECSP